MAMFNSYFSIAEGMANSFYLWGHLLMINGCYNLLNGCYNLLAPIIIICGIVPVDEVDLIGVFIGYNIHLMSWLVVWNMNVFFHSVGNFIIPTDELIFFRRVQTTNQICIYLINWTK